MDAATRWETEAIRAGSHGSGRAPQPSAQRRPSTANWVSLKEAEAATGVPVNTLRKWVRRADLPSYLESDGAVSLRMVDLDAVVSRARQLGRSVQPIPKSQQDDPETHHAPPDEAESDTGSPEGTMIVPIDAFNKMLSQLGNLHEAGQLLAEARERAAKAETESTFLRQRLAELRADPPMPAPPNESQLSQPPREPSAARDPEPPERSSMEPRAATTTTYWRYLTTTWSDRRTRRRIERK